MPLVCQYLCGWSYFPELPQQGRHGQPRPYPIIEIIVSGAEPAEAGIATASFAEYSNVIEKRKREMYFYCSGFFEFL
jgi:hypothetical protein